MQVNTGCPHHQEQIVAASPEPLTQPARNVPERLSVALQAAWEDLSECTHKISRASAPVQAAPSAAPSLMAIRDWYQETTRVLLAEPVKKIIRLQPIRRTLGAMRACDQESPAAAVHARMRTDADFQRLLAVTALDLCEPWRIWRGANHPASATRISDPRARKSRGGGAAHDSTAVKR
jgi:hypothetical protein